MTYLLTMMTHTRIAALVFNGWFLPVNTQRTLTGVLPLVAGVGIKVKNTRRP